MVPPEAVCSLGTASHGGISFSKQPGSGSVFGTSPPEGLLGLSPSPSPGSWGGAGAKYLLGTSPPSGGEHKHLSAKKFWSRVVYDDSLDPTEFEVGYIETVKTEQRKSGRDAWSERQLNQAVDVSFEEFKLRFPPKQLPFHRVLYYKQNGAIVWTAPRKPRLDIQTADNPNALEADFNSLSIVGGHGGLGVSCNVEQPEAEASGKPRKHCELPTECWILIMQNLGTRELCMLSRTNSYHRNLIRRPVVWSNCFKQLFGRAADTCYDAATVRRLCRRSELRSARWLEADSMQRDLDFLGTTCLKIDATKVISADGTVVRVWSHKTGRRISTLKGNSSPISCITSSDDLIATGCEQGTVRLWGMDDLKFIRTMRGHTGGVTDVHMFNGMPLSSSEDGTVRFWDHSQAAPVITLDAMAKVNALAIDESSGRIVSAGWSLDVWDAATAERLVQLADPLGDEDEGLIFDMMDSPQAALSPFTAVSQLGNILSSGGSGTVSLWDLRSASRVHHLELGENFKVTGLQMDDWKVLVAVGGSKSVSMYDIRSLSSGGTGYACPWPEPCRVFTANSRVQCFQFHGESLVVGASRATHVWEFGSLESLQRADNTPQGSSQVNSGGSQKEKKKKIPKRSTKYPKRTTR